MLMLIVSSVSALFVIGRLFAGILSAGSHHRATVTAHGMQPLPVALAVVTFSSNPQQPRARLRVVTPPSVGRVEFRGSLLARPSSRLAR